MTGEQADAPLSAPPTEPVSLSIVGPEHGDRDEISTTAAPPPRRPLLHPLSVVVLVAGLVLTGVLTATSRVNYLHTEQRLSDLQANLSASALGIAPVELERRVGSGGGCCW